MSDEHLLSNVSHGMRQHDGSDLFCIKLTAHPCPSPVRRQHKRTSENSAFFASKMSFFNQLGQCSVSTRSTAGCDRERVRD